MKVGDTVVRKSYDRDITFKIISIKQEDDETIYVLKGINLRIIADSPEGDLEVVKDDSLGKTDLIFDRKVNDSIKKIILQRDLIVPELKIPRINKAVKIPELKDKNLSFGRPGKILHIDGDSEYLEVCLKVYKQLSLNVVGKTIPEYEQPNVIVQLVKEVKPDIVVITGHDGMAKGINDFTNIQYYRNSKYFAQAVSNLRDYEPNYDDLVIFAGACQSCYEAILDAGANFASSPSRVLIHCLDPVFVCEKIAYTNVKEVVSIPELLENTITGVRGIGGLETRGKYREGFPKSPYV
ncbi:MAG: sporulation peptidase YabG [Bacillota bacterium]|nr:sporulation peptidase YabG [Bacillota bacterium]